MKSLLKGDLVTAAFSRARISGLTKSPSPEDLEMALDRLEDMMAEWEGGNICVGYFFEEEPNPNTPHNVPRTYQRAIKSNLAMGILTDFNKVPPQTLVLEAQSAMSSAYSALAKTSKISYPSRMPRGSGNTLRANRWSQFYAPTVTIEVDETNIMYEGDINDFAKSFSSYLRQDETVSSFTITVDTGLTVVSSSLASPVVNYRIQAITEGIVNVTISIVSSLGREETVTVPFEVKGLS